MTTIEKMENIDKLMEEYQVNDVYSLIEALEKGNQTKIDELQKTIKDYQQIIRKLNNINIVWIILMLFRNFIVRNVYYLFPNNNQLVYFCNELPIVDGEMTIEYTKTTD